MDYLISTDLDGTLLDHHDYSWEAAGSALELTRALEIPVILNTSKTAAEALEIRRKLDLNGPCIVENGSALVISREILCQAIISEFGDRTTSLDEEFTALVFGAARNDLLEFIATARAQHNWQLAGFADWTVAQVAEITGLDSTAAGQAAAKQYSEPFIWQDSEQALEEFQHAAAQAGFTILQGGRFFHLQGQTDKAVPLKWVRDNAALLFPRYHAAGNTPPKLICLGDNHNDVEMLNIADIPVCVRSPVSDFPSLKTHHSVIRTHGFGPVGWNEAIHTILNP